MQSTRCQENRVIVHRRQAASHGPVFAARQRYVEDVVVPPTGCFGVSVNGSRVRESTFKSPPIQHPEPSEKPPMTSTAHSQVVQRQFGEQASAYLNSAVHAQGAEFALLQEAVDGRGDARVLDLGCGAGHVSFNVAPSVGEVVAYDLSQQMLDVVAAAAADRGWATSARYAVRPSDCRSLTASSTSCSVAIRLIIGAISLWRCVKCAGY